MTDSNPESARARGQALRSARVARARTIRRRIVAGSLALFVAAWLLITLVLVSGHDPALAKKSSASSSSSGTTASPTSSTSDTSGATSSDTTGSTSSSDGSSSSSSTGSSGGSVSSLTTSQS